MYSVSEFGHMIVDERRTDAYVAALQRAIRQDSVVLDIGTGTGIFAMLACRFGARHVYALEPGDGIQVARKVAQENGYSDRITFIQDLSTRITLPERADVIISDLHGVLPFYGFHIPSIKDARERLLAPGGTLIPQADKIWAVVVSAAEQYGEMVRPWDANKYGLSMKAARNNVTNTWGRGRVKPDDFLVEPQCCAILDYRTIESPDQSFTLDWVVDHPGTAHGFSAWFDTTVAENICLTNAPGQPELVYGHAFFPWTNPVELSEGDRITLYLQAALVGDDYVWRWDTKIFDAQGSVKASYKQSTFYSTLLSVGQLAKQTANYVATLSDDGQVDRFILERMDGSRPLGEIADLLVRDFPGQFTGKNDALGRVGKLAQEYSR
jgi:protein arginine N-methyltransferase 1